MTLDEAQQLNHTRSCTTAESYITFGNTKQVKCDSRSSSCYRDVRQASLLHPCLLQLVMWPARITNGDLVMQAHCRRNDC